MRNKVAIASMLTLAQAMSGEITKQGAVHTSKETEPKPKKEPTPFKEQDGIKKMILEYRSIKSGKSKKGKGKQYRVIRKIESYLEEGFLTQEDL